MKHHRSPTQSYPHTHASLALRHPIPTLLSPVANTPRDDFQSNAWSNPRPPLSGLGIWYASSGLDEPQDLAWPMQVDSDGSLPGQIPPVCYQHFGDPRATLSDEHACGVRLCLDSDTDFAASDIIGLIPDVNMYDEFRRQDLPHTGVNPLDTICTTLHDMGVSHGEPALLTPKDEEIENLLSTTNAIPDPSPSLRVIQDIMSILVKPNPDDLFPPWSSAISPVRGLSPSQSAALKSPAHVPGGEPRPFSTPGNIEYSSTTHLSPILNAHLGIELGDLISRAEHFKTKYPERDIDRAWLSHFAGKLSDRGELLNDFRCYVVGCDQRNKRRDHILVHVGAHIGQRPFACSVCPLRFLRKNECKRHEASHSGCRPYSCDLCGQTFVRQDLVKRHIKRTHGIKDENQPSIGRQPRKKTRLA